MYKQVPSIMFMIGSKRLIRNTDVYKSINNYIDVSKSFNFAMCAITCCDLKGLIIYKKSIACHNILKERKIARV